MMPIVMPEAFAELPGLLLLLVLVPLLGAAAMAWAGLRDLVQKIAPWTALPAVLVALSVGEGHTEIYGWLLFGTRLELDTVGRIFLFFTGWIWLLAGLFSQRSVGQEPRHHRFYTYFLLTLAGNVGVTVARDLPSFLFFFSLMGVASYGLIVHRGDRRAIRAARIYLALLIAGEAALYAGAVLAAAQAHSWLAIDIARAVATSPHSVLIVVLLLVGFGVKAGFVPLHVSLPPAYQAAPPSAAAIVSGALSKAGLLGWLLFLPVGLSPLPGAGAVFLVGGLLAIYYGIVIGLMQREPKAMLAYSSISQIGFMTVLVGVGLSNPGAWRIALVATAAYALHHGLCKSALFVSVRVCEDGVVGRWRRRLVMAAILLPSLALAGAPWTSGAVAKHALKTSLHVEGVELGIWFERALSFGAVGTALLLARFVFAVWPRQDEQTTKGRGPGFWLPWALLVLSVVLAPWLAPDDALREMAREALGWPHAWSQTWPVLLAAILVGLCLRWRKALRPLAGLHIPPGDLLVPARSLLRMTKHRLRHVPGRMSSGYARATKAFMHGATRARAPLRRRLQAMEAGLSTWHTGATLVILLAVLVFFAVAIG